MSVRGDVRGRGGRSATGRESFETVVIGGGQAGLSVGYQLSRRDCSFVILEANGRIGDSWRKRWDSLKLFTPARYNGLEGWPFPADGWTFPTKDEMADYLEAYAARFDLPVRTGIRVERLSRDGDRFVVETQEAVFEAENVVVAMADFQRPRVPEFAEELDKDIVQLHSYEYRNPSQLRDGAVLVVGAGNSGAEISLDMSSTHRTWMSGRDTGHMPFRIEASPRTPGTPLRFPPRAHREHPDRPPGTTQDPLERRPGHPRQARRPDFRRRRTRPQGDRSARRTATPGRRSNPRRSKRHLVHRLPSRLLVD